MSANTAVSPVTSRTVRQDVARAAGRSRAVVRSSCGPVVGSTHDHAPRRRRALTHRRRHAATPGGGREPVDQRRQRVRRHPAQVDGDHERAVRAGAVLGRRPGRTPRRVVFDVGWLPASCGQVRMPSTGAASTSSTTSAASAHGSGRRPTRSAHRSVRVGDASSAGTARRVGAPAVAPAQHPPAGQPAQRRHQRHRRSASPRRPRRTWRSRTRRTSAARPGAARTARPARSVPAKITETPAVALASGRRVAHADRPAPQPLDVAG